MARDAAALGEFIRARRDRLSPVEAGIEPFPGARRVPGLRREELATAAGVSADYLRRVEQGRQRQVSRGVLEALGRALRLDEIEQAHLMTLAEPRLPYSPVGLDWPQRLQDGMARLLLAVEHLPAQVVGRRGEVLGRTELLPLILGTPLVVGSSFFHWLLTDPAARERVLNWPEYAAASVAALRGELGRNPWDTRLRDMADALSAADPLIAQWWADHSVRDYASVRKTIRHPLLGLLHFDLEILTAPHAPDQRLVIYTTRPGSDTAAAVSKLREEQLLINAVR